MLARNRTTMISLNYFLRLGSSNHYLHSNVLYQYNVAQFTIHICGLGNTGVSFYTFLKTLRLVLNMKKSNNHPEQFRKCTFLK